LAARCRASVHNAQAMRAQAGSRLPSTATRSFKAAHSAGGLTGATRCTRQF
jgi:hypothetical protein